MDTHTSTSSTSQDVSRQLWFTWRVTNISLWSSRNDKFLDSPVFTIAGSSKEDERKFNFRLYPRKYSTLQREFWLAVISHTEAEISFPNYVISVQHPYCYDTSTVYKKPKRDSDKELRVGIVKYSWSKHVACPKYIILETLVVKCTTNQSEEGIPIPKDPNLNKLSDDLKSLFRGGYLVDVEIEAGGELLMAHRIMLQARCPELLKEIKKPQGSSMYTIKVDTKASVMKTLLLYIYSGILNPARVEDELCVAANKYKLKHLVKKLEASPSEITATTEIATECKTFSWHIFEFSKLNTKEIICSPIFPINDGGLRLTLAFGGKDEYLRIAIRRVLALADRPLTCTCLMYHTDIDHNRNESFAQHSFETHREWQFPEFISKASLLRNKSRNLPSDILTIEFQFAMSEYQVASKVEETSYAAISNAQFYKDLNELSDDMNSIYQYILLKIDVFSDVALIMKDETTLHVHRAILSARLESLRETLSDPKYSKEFDMSEYEMAIDMSKCQMTPLHSLLHYVYTGKCLSPDENSDFKDLYRIGSEFRVPALTVQGKDGWIANNTPERAVDILPLAAKYSDEKLLLYSYKYILAYSDEILHSSKWMDLLKSDPEVANTMFLTLAEIYFSILKKKAETLV